MSIYLIPMKLYELSLRLALGTPTLSVMTFIMFCFWPFWLYNPVLSWWHSRLLCALFLIGADADNSTFIIYYLASSIYMRPCGWVEGIHCIYVLYQVVAYRWCGAGYTHCRVYSSIHKSSLDVDMVSISDHNHKLKTMAAERTMAKWCEIDGTCMAVTLYCIHIKTLTCKICLGSCLVSHPKNFHPSYRIFRHIHRTLNIDKNKLITQFGLKS